MFDAAPDNTADAGFSYEAILGPGVGKRTLATRIALLDVSERLFCAHGVDAVSLRQIAQQAGHANNNVVQYHFETKDRLVQTLLRWRVSAMEPRRAAMLTRAEAEGRLGDMRTLMEIMCLPLLDIVDTDGSHPFMQVLNDYMFRLRPRGMPHPADGEHPVTPAIRRVTDLVEQRVHFLPKDIAGMRSRICVSMFIHAIIHADQIAMTQGAPADITAIIEDTLEMAVQAMLAPPAAMRCQPRPAALPHPL